MATRPLVIVDTFFFKSVVLFDFLTILKQYHFQFPSNRLNRLEISIVKFDENVSRVLDIILQLV